MKPLEWICAMLLVVGGLNWATVGLFDVDMIAMALGGSSALIVKAVYTLVGLAAVYQMMNIFGIQKGSSPSSRAAHA